MPLLTMANVKVAVLEVDGTEYPYPTERILSAVDTAFTPGASGLTSTNVEAALYEVVEAITSSTKTIDRMDYAGGNAGVGRWLEWYQGLSSLEAPLEAINSLEILDMVLRTTGTTATCTVGFYNVAIPASPVLLYTLTMTAVKKIIVTGTPLFQVPAGGALAAKVNSGSITKPHLQMTIRSS